MNEIGQSFIAGARAYFTDDYLPKIERSLELLTDEQIWQVVAYIRTLASK